MEVHDPCMDEGYKELRLRGPRPSPWRIESIPKFADVPGRQFDCYRDKESRDGEAPTPPPSPIGTFKYPALFRGSNVWSKTKSIEAILTETCKSSNQMMTKPLTSVHDSIAAEIKIKPSPKEPQSLQDFLEDVKPAGGETKMHLWSQPGNTYCPELDLSSLTVASSPEGACRPSMKAGVKESSNSIKAGCKMERCFKTIPKNNFDVILKHVLSHDPVMMKHSSAPQIQRSMTLAKKPTKGEKGLPITKQ